MYALRKTTPLAVALALMLALLLGVLAMFGGKPASAQVADPGGHHQEVASTRYSFRAM